MSQTFSIKKENRHCFSRFILSLCPLECTFALSGRINEVNLFLLENLWAFCRDKKSGRNNEVAVWRGSTVVNTLQVQIQSNVDYPDSLGDIKKSSDNRESG